MLTAPPSAAPELLERLPVPHMQGRALAKYIWQVIYLLSLLNQGTPCLQEQLQYRS